VSLTLRLLGGLTTEEIAKAFLLPEPRSRSASSARSEPSARLGFRSRDHRPHVRIAQLGAAPLGVHLARPVGAEARSEVLVPSVAVLRRGAVGEPGGSTAHRMIEDGRLAAVRVSSGAVRVPVEDVLSFPASGRRE